MACVRYDDKRHATLSISFYAEGPREFTIVGTKGRIRFDSPSHCTDTVSLWTQDEQGLTNTVQSKFAFPTGFRYGFHFVNSQGLMYEIDGVTSALDQGLLECPEYDWEDISITARIMDEWRRQVKIAYPQDRVAANKSKL